MAEVQVKKDRLIELDIVRAFAILGVIFIHIIGVSFQYQTKWSLTWNLFVIFDQILRFAVPTFVFLSGYTLGLKYLHKSFNLVDFYKKRVWRILPWYFFWSVIIFIYTHYIYPESDYVYPIWKLILLGKVDYHLYFISMIFQLYLLFPLILYLFHKFNRKFITFVFIFQILLFLLSSFAAQRIIKLGFSWGDQQQYVFFGSWLIYFVIGVMLAQKGFSTDFVSKLKKISIFVVIIGLLTTIVDCFLVINSTGDLIISARSSRISVMIYALGCMLLIIVRGSYLLSMNAYLIKLLIYIGHRSFIIYLIHTLIIRFVSRYILPNNFYNLIVFSFLIVLFSVLVAEIAEKSSRAVFAKVFKGNNFDKI